MKKILKGGQFLSNRKTKSVTLLTKATLIAGLFLSTACTSDAEKQERKENAFDISGGYKVSKASGSELNMNFEIALESGRHDIVIYMERKDELSTKEQQLLSRNGLDGNRITSHFGSKITLGKGYKQNNLDGGENVSKDFGESSEFYVCSERYQYDSQHSVSYCLSGLIRRESRQLTGTLSMNISKTEKKKNEQGEDVTVFSSESASLKFQSDISLVFYKQYLGSWSGEVFVEYFSGASEDLKKLTKLTVAELGPSFEISPSVRSITHNGDVYSYNSQRSQNNIDLLKSPVHPAVEAVYTNFNQPNSKRIVLIGEIWSLGNLTGSIMLIDDSGEEVLATFRYKKD